MRIGAIFLLALTDRAVSVHVTKRDDDQGTDKRVKDNFIDGQTVTSQGCACTHYHGYTRAAGFEQVRPVADYGDVCGQWEGFEGNPFHDECAHNHHDWCGCSWCYVHSSCPGSMKSSVFKNGHWQKCSPGSGKSALDGKWIEKDGRWSDTDSSEKIYTVEEGRVTDGTHRGIITPPEKNKISLAFRGKQLEGTYVPDDEIEWDNGVVWKRRLGEEDAKGNADGKEKEIENLEKQIQQMKKKEGGTKKMLEQNALDGMWIDQADDEKPIKEIEQIYSIEAGSVTDIKDIQETDPIPVKISDTETGRVKITGFKGGDWDGTLKGSVPKDKIEWDNTQDGTWIRLKHKKIQDLIKESEEGKPDNEGESDDSLKVRIQELENQLDSEKAKGKPLEDKIQELEDQTRRIQELENQLNSEREKSANLDSLTQKEKENAEKITELKKQNNDLLQQNMKLLEGNPDMDQQLNELKDDLQLKIKDNENLQKQLGNLEPLEEAKRNLEDQLNGERSQKEELLGAKKTLEITVTELEEKLKDLGQPSRQIDNLIDETIITEKQKAPPVEDDFSTDIRQTSIKKTAVKRKPPVGKPLSNSKKTTVTRKFNQVQKPPPKIKENRQAKAGSICWPYAGFDTRNNPLDINGVSVKTSCDWTPQGCDGGCNCAWTHTKECNVKNGGSNILKESLKEMMKALHEKDNTHPLYEWKKERQTAKQRALEKMLVTQKVGEKGFPGGTKPNPLCCKEIR